MTLRERPGLRNTKSNLAAKRTAHGSGLMALIVIMALHAALSVIGITWGLPSRDIDRFLFGDDAPWPGSKIYRLANAEEKFAADRGADVDADPLDKSSLAPIPLTATDADVAKIYLRYRLYSYQPDEMITMMALARMRPGLLDLDPRLYQYGGLFIYPVGALLKLCGSVGLIDVRGDISFYLDYPEEFAGFYVVARAYSAAWGLFGVIAVFAIARRLGGRGAAAAVARSYRRMTVVICMAHEGKPHLPGAVLMLLAVLFAMRFLSIRRPRFPFDNDRRAHESSIYDEIPQASESADCREGNGDWWRMCVCCGAALGMVLSSWPILVLIPLVALMHARFEALEPSAMSLSAISPGRPRGRATDIRYGWLSALASAAGRITGGGTLALGVYLLTNPYVPINAMTNRAVLRSNFGNSLAMYEISRIGEGFMRVIELMIEGATLPLVAAGSIALILALIRAYTAAWPLIVPAALFFLQFVLIGAGKPAEYGRFGIFVDTALAIGAACAMARAASRIGPRASRALTILITAWVGMCGGLYWNNFRIDATGDNSRTSAAAFMNRRIRAARLEGKSVTVALPAEPAPYGCPPLDFAAVDVVLLSSRDQVDSGALEPGSMLVHPVDHLKDGDGAPGSRQVILPDSLARLPSYDTPVSWANKPFRIEPATGP